MSEKNYYEVLQINDSAESEAIHAAYKRLAKKYQHNERNLLEYILKMQKLNEAYLVLSDSEDRTEYDEAKDSSRSFLTTHEDENLDEDLEKEITIERDDFCENEYKIKVESCAAYLVERGEVNIIGEAVTKSGTAINKYKEIHFSVYDANGKLLGTNYTCWSKFARRQSFDYQVYFKPKSAIPAKVRVYPGE